MTESGGAPFPVEAPRKLLVAGAGMVVLIAVLLVLEQVTPIRDAVQSVDEWSHGLALRWETPFGLAVSHALGLLGGAVVTTPLRIVVAVVFVARRWWWHLAAWLASIAMMELTVTLMKIGVDRPRPPASLEVTRLPAFPSGHSAATAAIVVTLLLLLARPGKPRQRWLVGGAALVVLMSLSRVYLRVHWVSDVMMGVLVGTAAAALAVASLALVAERRARPRGVRLRD